MTHTSLKTRAFFFGIGALLLSSLTAGASQSQQLSALPPWQEARRPAAKGTRIPIPKAILKKILAEKFEPSEYSEKPEDPCNSKERAKVNAYRVSLRGDASTDVVVWARNSCYCGATGNCALWIFHASRGAYRLLLQTDMVRDFGFLRARTEGDRDLVAWSHDTAQRSPARLFQFDGKEYQEACGWEEEYEFKELPNGIWKQAGDAKIVNNTCDVDSSPRTPR